MEEKKMINDEQLDKVNGGIESSNIVGYDNLMPDIEGVIRIDISDSDIANEPKR